MSIDDNSKKIADWITVFYNRQHRAPNVSEIKTATGADIATISQVLKNYNFPVAEFKKAQAIQAAQKAKKLTGISVFFIVLFVLISFICVIVSAFFTARALNESFNNWFIAVSLSASIISFVALGQAAAKKVREKGATGLYRVISVLWYVALIYSMYSTTSIQFGEFYVKLSEYKTSTTIIFNEDKNKQNIETQERDIREQIKSKKEDRENLTNDIIKLKETELTPANIKKIESAIKDKEALKLSLQVAIDKHYDEIKSVYKRSANEAIKIGAVPPIKKANSYLFFVWLSGIFKGLNPDALQFISSLFPTIFIDLIAPIGLLIVTALLGGSIEPKQSFLKRLFKIGHDAKRKTGSQT